MKQNKEYQKIKVAFLKTLLYLKQYTEKNKCSLQFTIFIIDVLKNAFITQNKAIINDINNMLHMHPYNKELKAKIKEYYFILKLKKQNAKNKEKENLSVENFLKQLNV